MLSGRVGEVPELSLSSSGSSSILDVRDSAILRIDCALDDREPYGMFDVRLLLDRVGEPEIHGQHLSRSKWAMKY